LPFTGYRVFDTFLLELELEPEPPKLKSLEPEPPKWAAPTTLYKSLIFMLILKIPYKLIIVKTKKKKM